jgi:hypothetical protein
MQIEHMVIGWLVRPDTGIWPYPGVSLIRSDLVADILHRPLIPALVLSSVPT